MTASKDSSLLSFLAELLDNPDTNSQITAHKIIPAKSGTFCAPIKPFPQAINRLLESRDISLYCHQAQAINHIRAGHSLVVSTPTASGKSLIYNLPVLEKFLQDNDSTALYLFPLKALAQDQFASFQELISSWPREARPSAALYDGDTPEAERKAIRKSNPAILLTNPEMLHFGILPYHEKWTSFLAGLTHIIVDEAHIYRGIFGSHMSLVFRRLNRIVTRYGARPQYIFCTATLGNPQELAASLMGAEENSLPKVIMESSAPQAKRHFLFIDPLLSPATCAINILKKALIHNLRTIVYCGSRKMAELINMWVHESGECPPDSVSSYRAGFLPEERREIERKMNSGELKAVISTSALELGINIGDLDVCILVGYPGTITQTMQRGGRVGRAQRESAVFLVGGDDALDQYFLHQPEELFNRPAEKAVINPENEAILQAHLECAAAETPLSEKEAWLDSAAIHIKLLDMEKSGLLARSNSGEWCATAPYPHANIDLRSGGKNFVIEDSSGKPIGFMDAFRVWKETHPGAVYIHHGNSYLIDKVESGSKRIIARAAKVNWFTRCRGHKSTEILEEKERMSFANCVVCRGRLRVTEYITGYEKRSTQGQQLLCIIPLETPPHMFETEGFWIVIPEKIRKILEDEFVHFMGSIHALEHATIGLLPLEVMADRNDFGGISLPLHPQLGLAAVFIYDAIPGGAGLSNSAFKESERLLQAVLTSIRNCECEEGCPSCIHSPKCGAGNRPLSKSGAIRLLELLFDNDGLGDELKQNLIYSKAASTTNEEKQELKPRLGAHIEKKTPLQKIGAPNAKATSFFDRLASSGGIGKPVSAPALIKKLPPKRFVVFDVETRLSAKDVGGWQNTDKMGVSVVVLYERKSGKFFSYEQHELELFFEKLVQAELVIGFNSFRFDYQVLKPFSQLASNRKDFSLHKLPGLDLMQRVAQATGTRISLDNLCKTTLEAEKSANGLMALKWWKTGELDKIRLYCQKDVELTRDLYLAGLERGEVDYTNKAGVKVTVKVDFT